MKNLVFTFASIITLLFSACKKNNDSKPSQGNLTLNLTGLEDLGTNYVYEGWLMVNGSPITSGRFSVNNLGQLSQTKFSIPQDQLSKATAFILTIEPAVNDSPAPTDVHVLAGDFNGNSGNASVGHSAALGNNFSSTSGKYILATPTDGGAMSNEESGVWFLDNSSGSPATGLNLPVLPSGWKYEGWIVLNGTPISTGTFTSISASDDNASSSSYKGTVNIGPAFPGEDYLMNAPSGFTFPTDLRGKTVVISVEPFPDNSPAPFAIKPLLHSVPASASVHTPISMNQNLGSLPSGSFTR